MITIAPELHDRLVDMDSLEPWPGNPRRGSTELIRTSLQEHGQYQCIAFQTSTRRIIFGNNTYRVMGEEGNRQIAAEAYDCDDDEAAAIAAIDNRTTDLATYDEQLLSRFLSQFDEGRLRRTGWAQQELDDLQTKLRLEVEDATVPREPAAPAPIFKEVILRYTDEEYTRMRQIMAKAEQVFGTEPGADTVSALLRWALAA